MQLIELKAAHGLLERDEAEEIKQHIRMAKELVWRIEEAAVIDDSLREEIFRLNRLEYLCDKHELDWPVKGLKFRMVNVLKSLFS